MPARRSPCPPVALAAALACVVIASCAAPSSQAAPPSSDDRRPVHLDSEAPSGPLDHRAGPVHLGGQFGASAAGESRVHRPSSSEPEPAPSTSAGTGDHRRSRRRRRPAAEPTPAPDRPEPEPAPAPAARTRAPGPGHSGTKVVVIDPGHNGANSANPDIINALVPAGFGQTKPCNTTGTATNAGYPEHQFTWNVANDLRPILEASGITVVMTRSSDDGVGPCVNDRAAIGNDDERRRGGLHPRRRRRRIRARVLRDDGRAGPGRRRDGGASRTAWR